MRNNLGTKHFGWLKPAFILAIVFHHLNQSLMNPEAKRTILKYIKAPNETENVIDMVGPNFILVEMWKYIPCYITVFITNRET